MRNLIFSSIFAAIAAMFLSSCGSTNGQSQGGYWKPIIYTSVKGDYPLKIAKKNGITVQQFVDYNSDRFPNGLVPDGGRVYFEDVTRADSTIKHQLQGLILVGEDWVVGHEWVPDPATVSTPSGPSHFGGYAIGSSAGVDLSFLDWLLPLLAILLALFLLYLLVRALRDLGNRTAANEAATGQNTAGVATNAGNIETLQGDVAALSQRVTANTQGITDLRSAQAETDTRVAIVEEEVSQQRFVLLGGDIIIGSSIDNSVSITDKSRNEFQSRNSYSRKGRK